MNWQDDIDEMVWQNTSALDIALYVVEQYLLEDGVAGEDEYQDLLAEGWGKLTEAWKVKKLREKGIKQ